MAGFADPQSLGDLSTIIERTLLDTGRVFRKSGSMPSRAHVQRSIPFYHESFQNALDNLSEQIFIAKAFLEKDYEALKATSAPQSIADVAMSDVNQKVEPELQPLAEKAESSTELEQPALKLEEETVNQPAPETKPDTQDDHVVVKEESESKAPDSAFPGTNEELNFDSVLNTGGTNDFDLSLDFNDNDMGNQAFLSGSNFAGASATGTAEKPNTSQAQPMEATASTGGGAFDMELSKTDGDDNFLQGNATDDFMGPAESNFDDLFMDTENFGENSGDFNQLEGDTLMNVNELDDNWFN
ncbi:hypothetical protein N7508_006341 [Penicillium antarcticum]|uniref:uncharacterized protein n=1 Tax=Penicillium antarcticum TaxID=416450 RepID=UPI0023939975|nr:uncharacterized protein N7508_006341 [Penicillium antarcticum]KAJ5301478.1 hypothetical protein N7508_006341 [Penicillium antarcticum]